MVIGIGTGLVALGLALPTGLAFGFGYGYGVRQGYSAFRPPSQGIQDLKASPDPIKGSLGMGLQTAEERTNRVGLGRPSLQSQEKVISDTKPLTNIQRMSKFRSGGYQFPKKKQFRRR